MSPFHNQPTAAGERIQALDVLRGFAILGILIMNIQSFSMPGAAYLNPMAYGDMSGINKYVWVLSHLFADQKFMTIFSVLFGAGIILMTQRSVNKSGHSAGLHYRRTFWLLVIGLIHAHLIWYGDILVPYAICALFVYLFRNLRPYHLMIIGLLFIAVHTLIYGFFGASIDMWPPESLDMARQSWVPSMESMQEEIAALTGSLSEQISHNSQGALFMETLVFFMIFLWRAAGLMLIGMAMFKVGILTAEKSKSYYVRGLIFCTAIGLMVSGYGIYTNYKADFSFEYSMYLGSQWNYWGSLFTAFGYICAVMLIAKTQVFPWLRMRLAAVGRMALTNYLTQSILCVFIFWGVGFGLYGTFDRWQQFLVVIGVWIIQILWSKPWLDNYTFGPFEWLWRSLTYMKLQPFKKVKD